MTSILFIAGCHFIIALIMLGIFIVSIHDAIRGHRLSWAYAALSGVAATAFGSLVFVVIA